MLCRPYCQILLSIGFPGFPFQAFRLFFREDPLYFSSPILGTLPACSSSRSTTHLLPAFFLLLFQKKKIIIYIIKEKKTRKAHADDTFVFAAVAKLCQISTFFLQTKKIFIVYKRYIISTPCSQLLVVYE